MNKLGIFVAIVVMFGLMYAGSKLDSYNEEDASAATQEIIQECIKDGGTPAVGLSAGRKDRDVIGLCIFNQGKGTGV